MSGWELISQPSSMHCLSVCRSALLIAEEICLENQWNCKISGKRCAQGCYFLIENSLSFEAGGDRNISSLVFAITVILHRSVLLLLRLHLRGNQVFSEILVRHLTALLLSNGENRQMGIEFERHFYVCHSQLKPERRGVFASIHCVPGHLVCVLRGGRGKWVLASRQASEQSSTEGNFFLMPDWAQASLCWRLKKASWQTLPLH